MRGMQARARATTPFMRSTYGTAHARHAGSGACHYPVHAQRTLHGAGHVLSSPPLALADLCVGRALERVADVGLVTPHRVAQYLDGVKERDPNSTERHTLRPHQPQHGARVLRLPQRWSAMYAGRTDTECQNAGTLARQSAKAHQRQGARVPECIDAGVHQTWGFRKAPVS
eukprot:361496-Chlamydomonas_euryale.AAC.4